MKTWEHATLYMTKAVSTNAIAVRIGTREIKTSSHVKIKIQRTAQHYEIIIMIQNLIHQQTV